MISNRKSFLLTIGIAFISAFNLAYGQSVWHFNEKPVVPMATAIVSDQAVSVSGSGTSEIKKSSALKSSGTTSVTCPTNIDFEQGNFTNWKCYVGSAIASGTTNIASFPTTTVSASSYPTRFQITNSSSGNDTYGGFPRLCPYGGNYSVQLGNSSTGAQAEKLRYTFTIPSTNNNFVLKYYYAVVFQDPNHPNYQQPRFRAIVYDANNSSDTIDCASYDYFATSGLPGFQQSSVLGPSSTTVMYKPWSGVAINLTGYAGHTIILDFITEDCTLGGHFGYAYIDVSSDCSTLVSGASYCANAKSLTLTAPDGYETYTWWNQNYTKQLGTGSTITLTPPPANNSTINVDLIPYSGYGCRDTAYTVIQSNPVAVANFTGATSTCIGLPVSFTNQTTISDNSALSYVWNFGDGTTSTVQNPTKTYTAAGTYTVSLIANSIYGCSDTVQSTIKVYAVPTLSAISGTSKICIGQTQQFTNSTSGGTWSSTSPSVATVSSTGLVTPVNAGTTQIKYNVVNVCGLKDSVSTQVTIAAPSRSSTSVTLCKGQSYTFNGTSYNTAGTYTDTLTNKAGCDSIATLVLKVNLPTTSVTNISICKGQSYNFNGTVYNQSGTFPIHFTNAAGCDSTATLNLTILNPSTSTINETICNGNAFIYNRVPYTSAGSYKVHLTNVAGCDSTVTLNVTVANTSTSTTKAAICNGDSILFNGNKYKTAGSYTVHLTNSVGCDSAATLVLSVKQPTKSTTTASICQGSSYVFNGSTFTDAGTYTIHLTNAVGCDSVATLVLSVKQPTSSTTIAAICTGSSYMFNGTPYTTTGTYTVHLNNAAGCDSVATLILSTKTTTSSTTTVSICPGSSYTFNGTPYTAAGTYTIHFTNAAGCDSSAILILKLKATTSSTVYASICQGDKFHFNGTDFTSTGSYTYHFTNAAGCDSTSTLILTVKEPTSSTTNATICQGATYTFNGNSYNATGQYPILLTNKAGCDSTATLNLTVLPTYNTTVNAKICQGSSYMFNYVPRTVAGTYVANLHTVNGCDSIITLNLKVAVPTSSTNALSICEGTSYTFNNETYSTSGTYVAHLTNAAGCDSTATLILTVKPTSSSTTNISICQGGTYIFNGQKCTASGTYTSYLTNKAGCDSIATLNLTVNKTSASTTNATICYGSVYAFNGENYNTTGTYSATLKNAAGCDSTATLNLKVNMPSSSTTTISICQGESYTFNLRTYNATGTYSATLQNSTGCDSTATLYLIVNPPTSSTTIASICQGESYTFNGKTYNATGVYPATLKNAAGCDSTATLNLTVIKPGSSITNITIFRGQSYPFNGYSYSNAGTYVVHLASATGCDSTATLVLSLKEVGSSTVTASICDGDSYTFNGNTYTTAGTYNVTLKNIVGLDSIATLVLSVLEPTSSTTNAAICPGGSYTFNGKTYFAAGTYTAHFTNAVGCDSAAILALTMKTATTSTTKVSICPNASYRFNGKDYATAGTYTVHLTNAAGCDSAATLILAYKKTTSSTTYASICQGNNFTFNRQSYNTTGVYPDTLINAAGCDSIAYLNLTVNIPTYSTTNISLCQGESYTFNGKTYNATGTYSATLKNSVGCDSIATLNLTVNNNYNLTANVTICQGNSYPFCGSSLTNAGTYIAKLHSQYGCDSIVTLNLTVAVPTTSIQNDTIIQGNTYTFNGVQYSASGTYTAHLKNTAGCDSTATLNLIVRPIGASVTKESICQGDSYTFNNQTYNTAGTYTAILKSAAGYDSTAILELTIKEPTSSTTNVSICHGLTYNFNGSTYNTTGSYTTHLTNAAGCDSTAILYLTVLNTYNITVNAKICQGETYPFNGLSLTAGGTYTANLRTTNGCDSVVTLNLTVNNPSYSTTSISINKGQSYTFNGEQYTTSGTYKAMLTNAAGCDSTAALILTVIPISWSVTNVSICQGDTYWFNGQKYMTAGTYSYHLRNAAGYDSTATLILTVNMPSTSTTNMTICQGSNYLFNSQRYSLAGTYAVHLKNAAGCDSSAILKLSVISSTYSTTNASICKGDKYSFNGNTYQSAGTYVVHLTSSQGCDSAAVLVLKVKNPSSSAIQASICQGDSYLFNGTNDNVSGTYPIHFTNAVGCDSTATLYLTVKPKSVSTTSVVICQGTNYIFNNVSYSKSGTYTAHLTNVAGCDSTATLILTVKASSSSTTTASICKGDTYQFNGKLYTVGGTYTTHLTNSIGCDSAATLVLSIKQPTSSVINASACKGSSYSFCGKRYSNAGAYSFHFTNVAGCDSTSTLNLTISEPTTSTTTASICKGDSYTFNGKAYTAAGSYTAHLTNAAGCDSAATLVLSYLPSSSSSISASMCYGDKYTAMGKTYTTSGTYIIHYTNSVGCDSTVTLYLNVMEPSASFTYANICMGETFTFNGTDYGTDGRYTAEFENAAGCDSTSTLILTVNPTYYRTQAINCLQGDTYNINGNEYGVSGTYTDHLRTKAGCDSTVVTYLTVTPIPNTFTPNGDGINDRFLEGWYIKVYNRNGLKLYEGSDGWDGKYNGRLVSQDTYFYVLLYDRDGKRHSREGYIVVVH